MRRSLPLALACLVLAGCAPQGRAGSSSAGPRAGLHLPGPAGDGPGHPHGPGGADGQPAAVRGAEAGRLDGERRVRAQRAGALRPRLRPGRPRAVEVVLQQFCDIGKVTRVPSDHPGTRRYQEVISIEPGHTRGGPLPVPRRLRHLPARLPQRRAGPAAGRGLLALGFVTRDALRQTVDDYTDGRVPLDPPRRGERGREQAPDAAPPPRRRAPAGGRAGHPAGLHRHVVRPDDVGVLEEDLFRLANDLPTALFPAFWVVMQAGNVLAVGVAAAVVAATCRFWLAANLANTGIGVAGRQVDQGPGGPRAARGAALRRGHPWRPGQRPGSCPSGTPPWPWPSPP